MQIKYNKSYSNISVSSSSQKDESINSIKPKYIFKIICVGESGVGKSSIILRNEKSYFHNDYNSTIGIEFSSKILEITKDVVIKLQIWDTAGQESFRSVIKSFYRNALGILLVYDITKKDSLLKLKDWMEEAKIYSENLIMVLLGNKKDCEDLREISYQQGETYQKIENIDLFFETSAKTGENIETVFQEMAKLIYYCHFSTPLKLTNILKNSNMNAKKFKLKNDNTKDENSCFTPNMCC